MSTDIINLFFYALAVAVMAVAYMRILSTEPVLNWWFRWGLNFNSRFFYRPVWGCEKCFAGQVALWTYALNWFASYLSGKYGFSSFLFKIVANYGQSEYSLQNGLIFVFGSVLFTTVVSKMYEKL